MSGPRYQWSQRFELHVAEIRRNQEVNAAFKRVLSWLDSYSWEAPDPGDFYSVYKNSYVHRFHKEYLLALELIIDRRSGGSQQVTLRMVALQKG